MENEVDVFFSTAIKARLLNHELFRKGFTRKKRVILAEVQDWGRVNKLQSNNTVVGKSKEAGPRKASKKLVNPQSAPRRSILEKGKVESKQKLSLGNIDSRLKIAIKLPSIIQSRPKSNEDYSLDPSSDKIDDFIWFYEKQVQSNEIKEVANVLSHLTLAKIPIQRNTIENALISTRYHTREYRTDKNLKSKVLLPNQKWIQKQRKALDMRIRK